MVTLVRRRLPQGLGERQAWARCSPRPLRPEPGRAPAACPGRAGEPEVRGSAKRSGTARVSHLGRLLLWCSSPGPAPRLARARPRPRSEEEEGRGPRGALDGARRGRLRPGALHVPAALCSPSSGGWAGSAGPGSGLRARRPRGWERRPEPPPLRPPLSPRGPRAATGAAGTAAPPGGAPGPCPHLPGPQRPAGITRPTCRGRRRPRSCSRSRSQSRSRDAPPVPALPARLGGGAPDLARARGRPVLARYRRAGRTWRGGSFVCESSAGEFRVPV